MVYFWSGTSWRPTEPEFKLRSLCLGGGVTSLILSLRAGVCVSGVWGDGGYMVVVKDWGFLNWGVPEAWDQALLCCRVTLCMLGTQQDC